MESSVCTVMFTDLVGSVKIYTKISDSLAAGIVRQLDEEVRRSLPGYKGKFIKSTGDGLLLTFEEASGAVRCAAEIHRFCDILARDRNQDLAVRIAAHTGEILHSEGDIHGNTVNLAARLLGVTGACETSLTAESLGTLTGDDRQGFIPHGPEVFKGFGKFSYIYKRPNPNPMTDATLRPESVGDEDTSMMTTENLPKNPQYLLDLEHQQIQKKILIKEGETHVIGRAPECGTSVPDRMFSGTHMALAVVEGILWAFDLQSSNGVFYKGRRLKRRKPIELDSEILLPNARITVKLP
jgi:class 3 adenylate cyclase